MIRIQLLGNTLYFDPITDVFSLFPIVTDDDNEIPSIDEIIPHVKPTCYSFCLEISDTCNLNCDYCFNVSKSNKLLSSKTAIEQLDKLFALFPDGQKYFIDMSGKGEPLLNLKAVLEVAEYCHRKSDEKRVEVLPMFVSNGTLLTKEIAVILQKRGILFGVSIDGNQIIHDKHRKTFNEETTYEKIISNVKSIPNRDYVGCSCTITNDVFDIKQSVIDLSKTFKTLSYRFVRGKDYGISDKSAELWIKEYDKLAIFLYDEALSGVLDHWFCLMNGDDYFGRFLCRAILNSKTINRCDGGISRFSIDQNGAIYPCSAATCCKELEIKNDLAISSKEELSRQAHECLNCDFKFFCGGECPIELARLKHPNYVTCKLTKHMICLAFLISLKIEWEKPDIFAILQKFVRRKQFRYRADEDLEIFLEEHPTIAFSEAKKEFDQINKRY